MVENRFPVIYRSFPPFLTHAGLLLVPINGIVFAGRRLYPRLGLKTCWFKLNGARLNVPTLIRWWIALAVGFGLDILNIFPFYHLFVPAWIVSLLSYTLLAKRVGVGRNWLAAFDAPHHKVLAAHSLVGTWWGLQCGKCLRKEAAMVQMPAQLGVGARRILRHLEHTIPCIAARIIGP